MPVTSPRADYRAQLTQRQQDLIRLEQLSGRLSLARLLTGISAVLVVAFSVGVHWIAPWWLVLPVVTFIILAVRHESAETRLSRTRRGTSYYERGLARMENRWIGTGNQGASFANAQHLYADDLDLFGRGSLFELLCAARTSTGERTLAGWLLQPGEPLEVAARQKSVAELRPMEQLREDLALLGDDVRAAIDDHRLAAWGNAPTVPFFPAARWIALVLAILAAVTFGLYMTQQVTLRPFLYVILAEVILGFVLRGPQRAVTGAMFTPSKELHLLALILERIEREEFTSPGLRALKGRLAAEGKPPTQQIRALERLVDRLDWSRNLMFAPVAAPLLWAPQFAMAIERWRVACGPHIADWVAAIGEFEALSSLAAFAYERPEAAFPEVLDSAQPLFEAVALTHPLIAPDHAIANDVSIGSGVRLWIVSGSNMSGKSTLLRAVGLSAVLAWAGAPVAARSLRVSRLHIGASLSTHDSLADNRSRFYAEISRLRDIVDLARRGLPTLFLLDELLSGTNSHDRRAGAEALIRGLLDRAAIGMVTTHDLALAHIAEQMEGSGVNVHFEDHLEGGQIRFDYRLRPGVVARGNALELMRAVGLDV